MDFSRHSSKCTSDTHNLAGCLHLCGKRICGSLQTYRTGKRGIFANDIVQCRLEACRCVSPSLISSRCHADSNLCGNSCDGVAACLGCQCRGTGNAGVYLDYSNIRKELRVQCELDITAALLPSRALDDLKGTVTEHADTLCWSASGSVPQQWSHRYAHPQDPGFPCCRW